MYTHTYTHLCLSTRAVCTRPPLTVVRVDTHVHRLQVLQDAPLQVADASLITPHDEGTPALPPPPPVTRGELSVLIANFANDSDACALAKCVDSVRLQEVLDGVRPYVEVLQEQREGEREPRDTVQGVVTDAGQCVSAFRVVVWCGVAHSCVFLFPVCTPVSH